MQTRTYQFWSQTSQANATNRQIIQNGYIYAVQWACYLNSAADDASVLAELSFSSTSQMSTDNAQGVISAINIYQNILTSGFSQTGLPLMVNGLYIPVGIGQIIYLNTSMATGGTAKALLFVAE